jgi:hypothetical protein
VVAGSLARLREKLIKIGAKVVSHGRYVTVQMAEVAVSRCHDRCSPTSCRRSAGSRHRSHRREGPTGIKCGARRRRMAGCGCKGHVSAFR